MTIKFINNIISIKMFYIVTIIIIWYDDELL